MFAKRQPRLVSVRGMEYTMPSVCELTGERETGRSLIIDDQ